jgi:hypothetical protein
METSGGGGYGDPLERDPSRVAHDVDERRISRPVAEALYGVVLADAMVDTAATRERRGALREGRVHVELGVTDDLDEERLSGIVLPRTLAERLDAGVGSVLEILDPRGAPLRVWLFAVVDVGDRRALVSPRSFAMLGLTGGSRVHLRALAPAMT